MGEAKSFSLVAWGVGTNGLGLRMRGSRTGVRLPVEKGRLTGDGGMMDSLVVCWFVISVWIDFLF